MQNISRRMFLGGKKPDMKQWDQFLLQLQRKTQGTLMGCVVEEGGDAEVEGNQVDRMIFGASSLTDLHQLRQLCADFTISVSLYPLEGDLAGDGLKPTVYLDLSALNQLMPVDAEKNQWFMQAGVTMAQLKEVGFEGLEALPEELTVAAWLANPNYHHYDLSHIGQSGLLHASLLQADGSVSSLGPFGAQNTKPLNTVFLQQLVPQLFELTHTESAQKLLEHKPWLGRFRLDVLSAHNPSPNLAHLLLGHQGALGVIEWVVLDKTQYQPAPCRGAVEKVEPLLSIAAQELDTAVKQLFDANELFSS